MSREELKTGLITKVVRELGDSVELEKKQVMSWLRRKTPDSKPDVEQLIAITQQNERDRICLWLLRRSIILCRDATNDNVLLEARAAEALQVAAGDIRGGQEP
jgi:hypothetical protein